MTTYFLRWRSLQAEVRGQHRIKALGAGGLAEVQRRQVDGASVVRQVRVAAHALLKHALGELNQDLDVLQAQAQGHRQARSWHSRQQGSWA